MTDQEMIDQFIATRGVTHCPSASLVPTQASIELEGVAGRIAPGNPLRSRDRKRGWARYWELKRAHKS